MVVNGDPRAGAEVRDDPIESVRMAATLLDAVGERLAAGDWLIAGAVVQLAVHPGDDVVADLGRLGSVALPIAS